MPKLIVPLVHCQIINGTFTPKQAENAVLKSCRATGDDCDPQYRFYSGARIPDVFNRTKKTLIEVKTGYQPWSGLLPRQAGDDGELVGDGLVLHVVWDFFPNPSGISWPTVATVLNLNSYLFHVNIFYLSDRKSKDYQEEGPYGSFPVAIPTYATYDEPIAEEETVDLPGLWDQIGNFLNQALNDCAEVDC
jgi:hypothetical protein